jgi:hypothetical protein
MGVVVLLIRAGRGREIRERGAILLVIQPSVVRKQGQRAWRWCGRWKEGGFWGRGMFCHSFVIDGGYWSLRGVGVVVVVRDARIRGHPRRRRRGELGWSGEGVITSVC